MFHNVFQENVQPIVATMDKTRVFQSVTEATSLQNFLKSNSIATRITVVLVIIDSRLLPREQEQY